MTYALSYIDRNGVEHVLKTGEGDQMARAFDRNACRDGETWLVRASDGSILDWKGVTPWELRSSFHTCQACGGPHFDTQF